MPTDQPALPLRPVQPGDEIEVPAHGYSFGADTLRMRVVEAGPPFRYHGGGLWQEVHGPELRPDGTPRGIPPRVATVKISEVRALNGG